MAWIGKGCFKKYILMFLLSCRPIIPDLLLKLNAAIYAVVLQQFYNLGVESICLSLWLIVGRAGAVGGEVATGTDGAAH